MNTAMILAGGVGRRLGAGIPKQFVCVLGKPVLAYTLETFQAHPEIDAIEVVCVQDYMDQVEKIKNDYHLTKIKWITDGGAQFQDSVISGLRVLENELADDDIVLFHFAVSCFVEPEIISDAIRVCKEKGNAISSTDFYLQSGIKKLTSSVTDPENYSDTGIKRETITCMGSPHAFRHELAQRAYREVRRGHLIAADEYHTAAALYAIGERVYFSKGSQCNIKITRKEDLDLFEGYLLMKQRHKNEKND